MLVGETGFLYESTILKVETIANNEYEGIISLQIHSCKDSVWCLCYPHTSQSTLLAQKAICLLLAPAYTNFGKSSLKCQYSNRLKLHKNVV